METHVIQNLLRNLFILKFSFPILLVVLLLGLVYTKSKNKNYNIITDVKKVERNSFISC